MMLFANDLIEVADLQKEGSNPRLKILDCTIDKVNKSLKNNKLKLIPNSLFFDIEGELSDKNSKLPHTLTDQESFQKYLQRIGINQEDVLVVYDRWGIYSSPRAWWMLKTMGVKEVYILNGGFPEWNNHKLPVSNTYSNPLSEGNIQLHLQENWLADKNYILNHYKNKTVDILDARSKGRFTGLISEPRKGLISGHIPHSVNLPFEEVLNGTKYKPKEELISLFEGLNTQQEQVFTCGSGITASIIAFANYYAGNKHIRVYDGSWTEWGQEELNLPIAR